MLQIISGKFYKGDQIEMNEGKGILYSNIKIYKPIVTCIGTLEPVDVHSVVCTYLFTYNNKLEINRAANGFALVRTGDPEIIEQFKLISFFGLKAFFSTEKEDIIKNCRSNRLNVNDKFQPSKFVKRFFDQEIHLSAHDEEQFVEFVEKMIGLPRTYYNSIMTCLNNFYHALVSLNYNIDLSYSLLVYCLESLAQTFDDFSPEWSDYDFRIRNRLDTILEQIDPDKAAEIKSVLLESSHLKLQKRFVQFSKKYVQDCFFTELAQGIENPLKKSDLDSALQNAYDIRSRYVHQLESLMKQLIIEQIANSEVFNWEHTVYLTLNGFVRLWQHILTNFINSQPILENEDYDWRNELPGIVYFYPAPQYWLHRADSFTEKQATYWLEGFLSLLETNFLGGNTQVNLNDIIEKIEYLIPRAEKRYKYPLLAFYVIYNSVVSKEGIRPAYQKILSNNQDLYSNCSIELMTAAMFSDGKWPWSINECVDTFTRYKKKSYERDSLRIPPYFEVGLILGIANEYFLKNDFEKYKEYVTMAIYELPSKSELQKSLNDCLINPVEIDLVILFKRETSPEIEFYI